MKKPRIALTMMMLVALLVSALPMVSLAQDGGNPNEDCPDGTLLVAKFEWTDQGFQEDPDVENIGVIAISNVTLDDQGEPTGADWTSTVYYISYIVVKGGDDATQDEVDPPAQSGSFSNANLPLNPSGYPPAISNVKFCAPEEEPETGSLEVTKTVMWGKFQPDTDQTFEICITGPSYPDGDCQEADYDGDTLTWDDLEPGEYTVTETNPGMGWKVEITGSPVTVVKDETAQAEVTNTREETAAVDLVSFTVEAGADGVTLAWETATEIDNAGFNLYRALLQDGPYTQVNRALIAAEGDPVSGASYSFVDTPDYGTFYYKLEDVDYNGVSTMHGPVKVTVARPLRRPLYRPRLPEF